ncbi:MAG: translation initiation factor IF-2 [Bdellovibrionales bacterium RIFOXYA1_FULL_36_14]|nr:MAG: translation initiation factor IF-2 [Bdellovibrionales bacterium RIFOXYA1_FULL_36_14]
MPRKIFELASELQIGAIELVEVLRAKGMSIRNHMATLEDDEVDRALSLLKADSKIEEQSDSEKKKVVKKKKVVAKASEGQAASKKIVTIKKDSKSKDEVKKKVKKDSHVEKPELKKKTVIIRRTSETDEPQNEIFEEQESPEIFFNEENIQDENEVNLDQSESDSAEPEVVKTNKRDSLGLRVVSKPKIEHLQSEDDLQDIESEPDDLPSAVEDKKIIYKERVHTFTPVYIPPKKEVEKPAKKEILPIEEKVIEDEDSLSADSKNARKRMSGLASIMSGKAKINISKSQKILDDRSEEELKSYAALSSTGKPLYTQVKRKKVYMGQSGKTEITETKESKRVVEIHKVILANELAHKLGIKFSAMADQVLDINLLINENDYIGHTLAKEIAALWNYRVEETSFKEEEILVNKGPSNKDESHLPLRNPVITIMGHVDHGKTSLLDYIRKEKVAQGEAGGITQHIGAYQVDVKGRKLTFLDTPGHAAFTTIRQRGAQVTDIVVLIVAADDGVMPQTRESIKFCREADVPIIVAINKIDKESVNPDRIKQELAEFDLTPEEWGGQTQCVAISALKGTGVDELLEAIQLQAEILELRGDPKAPVKGVVIESKVEQGRGPMSTILIQEGTLYKGDTIVVGESCGRARNLMDYAGNNITSAGPSVPVQILGLDKTPNPGEELYVVKTEREAKKIVANRVQERKDAEFLVTKKAVSLEDFFATYKDNTEFKELKLIVRTDVHGSYEAIKNSVEALGNQEVGVKVISGGVGAISDNDVMLAAEINGYIIGFNMRPITSARRIAEQKGVDIKTYSIIYELINDVKLALEGLLEPEFEEKYIGRAEVRDTFVVPKIGMIAGSIVIDGKIQRGCSIRLLREGKIIFDGKMASLKRFKDDVKEVNHGYECGIGLDGFNDLKLNDVFEAYVREEKRRKLEENKVVL